MSKDEARTRKIRMVLPVVLFLSTLTFLSRESLAQIPAQEREALISLYNSTNGSGWLDNTGWLGSAGTECNWHGIGCNADKTSVLYISLSRNELKGNIPPSLGSLENLRQITLSYNQLSGGIPPSFGNLINLQWLDLRSSQLSGSIPSELGNLRNLEDLYLFDNQLSGGIPPSLGNLTSLRHLYLSNNQLSGSIPRELGILASLQLLDISANQLNGSIPSSLGNLTILQWLDLSHNQLSGTIPSELGNLRNLEFLFLSYNQLGGSIPPELGSLGRLLQLDLTDNQLSGSIPSSLGNLSNLQHLKLGRNHLSGLLPPSLVNLTNLRSLHLEYNALFAADPTLLGFLNSIAPQWKETQAVAPTDIVAIPQSNSSIMVSWSLINNGAKYAVYQSTRPGGPYSLSGSITYSAVSGYVATDLAASTTYYFVVRSVYEPVENPGPLFSENSVEVSATTPAANPVPSITSISPNGVMAGGTGFDLEVYGENFVRPSQVLWNGVDLPGDKVFFLSSQQLRAVVPASLTQSAGEVTIQVFTPPNGGGKTAPLTLTIGSPAPATTGLNLQSLIAGRPGYEVVIYGANFLPESVGEWNGLARVTDFINSGQLVVKVVAEDIAKAGNANIAVRNPDGRTSNGQSLEIVTRISGVPDIKQLIPDVIPEGSEGFTLVVLGSGFAQGSIVEWNGRAKETVYESETRLSAQIQASDLSAGGVYYVTVRKPGTQGMMLAVRQGLSAYDDTISNTAVVSNMNPAPRLKGLTPAAAAAGSGGFDLTLTGTGYVTQTMVRWNDEEFAPTYISTTELRVSVSPDHLTKEGTATIEVRNPSPGGGAQTKTFTITTAAATKAMLLYPRLVNIGGDPDQTEATGIVVANLNNTFRSTLTAWAYAKDGGEIRGEKITNPVSLNMSPVEQQAIVDDQVFGGAFRGLQEEGWLKLESTEKKVVGFFMMFNDSVTFLDGANAATEGVKEFVFSEVEDKGFMQMHVANPNDSAAELTFELRDADGHVRAGGVQQEVKAHGTLSEPFGNIFASTEPHGGDYVRVTSSGGGVVPFEYMGEKPKYVFALNGQDAAGGSTMLYAPQYISGSGYQTTLSVVNLSAADGTMTLRLIGDSGIQIGQTKIETIKGRGKLRITNQNYFGTAEGQTVSGYVEVKSNGVLLAGDVVFGDPRKEQFASSLPLVSELLQTMVFGHVVMNETYWTGIVVLNPGAVEAAITINLYDRVGNLVRQGHETLAAGHRTIGILTQYFEGLLQEGFKQGYMTITSDRALASFALFGNNELKFLSAIPPQVMPED